MLKEKYSKAERPGRFYRSRRNKMIDGVCGGLSEYLGIDPLLVRILWFLSVFVDGLGIIAYILAMIFVPVNPAHENYRANEERKNNAYLFWGIMFIVFGLFFLYRHLSVRYYWDFPPWVSDWGGWSILWANLLALGLIFSGIAYIVYVLRKGGEGKVAHNKLQKPLEVKKLYRASDDRLLGGVCSGIARYFNIDSTLVRIGFVVFALITGFFFWVIVYIILVFLLPQDS